MWIFSTIGFFSIVRERADGACHHLRARRLADLENLRALVPELPVPCPSYPGSDYPWRILCPSALLPGVFAALGSRIDYSNFKGVVGRTPGQQDKLPAYHKIWAAMAAWGAGAEP